MPNEAYAKRADQNHRTIAKMLRQFGCKVIDLHMVGRGVPDMLVLTKGSAFFIEVKTKEGKLNNLQAEFIVSVQNSAIVRNTDDVIMFVEDFALLRNRSLEEAKKALLI